MLIDQLIEKIKRDCKPGMEFRVSARVMRDLQKLSVSDFTVADIILEQIIGSAYEYGYQIDVDTGDTIFFHLSQPLNDGRRSYVSPDRYNFFNYDSDTGIFSPKG